MTDRPPSRRSRMWKALYVTNDRMCDVYTGEAEARHVYIDGEANLTFSLTIGMNRIVPSGVLLSSSIVGGDR